MQSTQSIPEGPNPAAMNPDPAWVHQYVDAPRMARRELVNLDPQFQEDGFLVAEPIGIWQNVGDIARQFDWKAVAAVFSVYLLSLMFWKVLVA